MFAPTAAVFDGAGTALNQHLRISEEVALVLILVGATAGAGTGTGASSSLGDGVGTCADSDAGNLGLLFCCYSSFYSCCCS